MQFRRKDAKNDVLNNMQSSKFGSAAPIRRYGTGP